MQAGEEAENGMRSDTPWTLRSPLDRQPRCGWTEEACIFAICHRLYIRHIDLKNTVKKLKVAFNYHVVLAKASQGLINPYLVLITQLRKHYDSFLCAFLRGSRETIEVTDQMAIVHVNGRLVKNYGYCSLSIFSGFSL